MVIGQVKKRGLLLVILTVLVTCFTGLALARPGAVICAMLDRTHLTRWADSKYAESPSEVDHRRYDALLAQAVDRINKHYGKSVSKPRVVFFDSENPFYFFKPNPYGSTHFIGSKACIFIGPHGQNVDVVAHELVHTDIARLLGAVNRALRLPAWLDEGLAMQVDYRPQYNLERARRHELAQVSSWHTYSDFFETTEEGELTQRYALAKARVGRWIDIVGSDVVYTKLKTIVSGSFSDEQLDSGLIRP